jgi:tetratricopeptide (TPR) repeat protein
MIRLDQAHGEDAIYYFEQALQAFKETGSERGQALVYVSYGRLMRQWGLLKERQSGRVLLPEQEQYRKAHEMLNKAIETFRQINDLSNLSEALNEKGTLLRQQGQWNDAINCFEESADLAQQIGNQYREVDNLQDIGITYDFAGQPDQAMRYAKKASDIAQKIKAYYLFARAQRTVANVLFARGDYDQAFEMACNALVGFMRLDPEERSHGIAKREVFYDEWMDWISEMILRLPSRGLAQAESEYLIQRWEREEARGRKLAELYPGFITRMHCLAQNYPFLTEARKGECNEQVF